MSEISILEVSLSYYNSLFSFNSLIILTLSFSPPAPTRLFRSVLSVKDEFYHRHIIQHDLFAPVFDLFRNRSSSVGNNLLSSAILEMCDFICIENIKSLIDYIVTTHLTSKYPGSSIGINNLSLEEIANPHVETFKELRRIYNENTMTEKQGGGGLLMLDNEVSINGSRDGIAMNGEDSIILNEKALEDQRKFRQADEDDSYFNDDDDA